MSKTLSIRLDNDIKNAADILFGRLGTNTASAVKMFIYTAISNDKIPSREEIKANSTENGNWLFDEEDKKFINPKILEEIEKSKRNENYTYMNAGENVDDFLKRAMDNV